MGKMTQTLIDSMRSLTGHCEYEAPKPINGKLYWFCDGMLCHYQINNGKCKKGLKPPPGGYTR